MNASKHTSMQSIPYKKDEISEVILRIINNSNEPLETKEIEMTLDNETRIKIFNRLKDLRGEGLIRGKMVGSGKGAWIWWRQDLIKRSE